MSNSGERDLVVKIDNKDASSDLIVIRLESFKVIRNRYIRWIVAQAPTALILILLFDLLRGLDVVMGTRTFVPDMFRLTFAIGIIIEFLIINNTFSALPKTLRTIWNRGLIISKNEKSKSVDEFVDYLNWFEESLNSKRFLIVSVVLALVALRASYPFVYRDMVGEFPSGGIGQFLYIEVIVGFFAGFVFWRYGIIAVSIRRLAQKFKLKIQPQHPDQCGGLKPLGDLCLTNAFIILVPIIILSFWLGVATLPEYEIFNLWSDIFSQYLLVLSVISIFVFFRPLYLIHQQMTRRLSEVQQELDELSAKSEDILLDLRTQADTLSSDEGEKQLKTLDFIQRVYDENKKVPTWPIDWKIFLKFSTAQAIPILSLLGMGEPIMKIVSAFIEWLNGLL